MRAGQNGPAARAALLLALVVLAYLFVDRPFSTLSHSWHHPALAIDLTYIADIPLPLAALVLLAGIVRPLPRPLLAAALATLAALALKDELKWVLGRPWPETWVDHNPSWIGTHTYGFFPFHGGRGYASFPSGHTTAISAPASVLWRAKPPLRPLAALLVLLVAAGLLVSDYHFVSDVLAGLAVGIGVAGVVWRLIGAPPGRS